MRAHPPLPRTERAAVRFTRTQYAAPTRRRMMRGQACSHDVRIADFPMRVRTGDSPRIASSMRGAAVAIRFGEDGARPALRGERGAGESARRGSRVFAGRRVW